jgi:hypothetical protein
VYHSGRKLISLSNEYALTVQQAGDIMEAMFDTPEDTLVSVKFSVKLTQVGLMVGSLLEIGTDEAGKINELPWNRYPDQTRDFNWAQYTSGNAKMGARVSASYTEQKRPLPPKSLWDDEWGLFKLTRQQALSFSADETGPLPKYRCLWEFKAPDGSMYHLQAEFSPKKKLNPFDDAIFTRFTMAETVSK